MIHPVKVTRTFRYTPEEYLEDCIQNEETPTQEGFLDYIRDWIYDDFESYVEDIGYLDIEVEDGNSE